MSGILLAAWVALLGADRLDLAGGAAGAVLTPFLALTPALVIAQWRMRRRTGVALAMTTQAAHYATLLLALLVVVGGSVYVSGDPATSTSRGLLLAIQALGTLAVALHVAGDPESRQWLATGATAGLLLFVLLDVLAALSFAGWLPTELSIGPAVLRLDSYGYAGIIPRLSGTVLDPNRAGLVLLFYAALARRSRWLVLLLLPLTLSRSAALAGIAMAIVALRALPMPARQVPRTGLVVGLAMAGALLAWVGSSPDRLEGAAHFARPFAERLSIGGEGSASEHGSLLGRAADEGTRSAGRVALGLGWGASYTVLQDFFPGNRYGNFHSLYATAFVEGGLVAMLLIVILLLAPIVRGSRWRVMVAGLAAFSLFYQATTEPAFWFSLAMAWLTMPAPLPRRVLTPANP